MAICDRCGKKTNSYIMSMFNMDEICMDCKKKERKHAEYQEACRADSEQVQKGNFNYPGIGKPKDL